LPGTLLASFCDSCGFAQLAERRCDRCHSETLRREIAAAGAVLAATVVERAPDDVVLEAPFAMALVRLDDGPQLLAVAPGPERFEPGARVTIGEELLQRAGAGVTAHVMHEAQPSSTAGPGEQLGAVRGAEPRAGAPGAEGETT
jgi:uncharacterized OB-fold protein